VNNQQRADSWVKSQLQVRGKPLFIVETRKNNYLAVVDKNEGGFEMVLANRKSGSVEQFKSYDNARKPIEVLLGEARNRNLRIVLRND
jgi:hypothetical protein